MAGITQNGQKRLVFNVVSQLRIAVGLGFVKKRIVITIITIVITMIM